MWLLFLLVLIAITVVGWYSLDGYVKSQLEIQLTELGLGSPEISSVSTGSSGITARQVQFRHAGASQPWLSLEELKIDHPLSSLVAGDNHYNAIELNGIRTVIDLAGAGERRGSFELSELKLPAQELRFNDAELVLKSEDKRDFTVSQLSGSIKQHDQLQLKATIGQMAGGRWQAEGSFDQAEAAFNLQLESVSLNLETGQWADWPLVPKGLDSIVTADGQVRASIQLAVDASQLKELKGAITVGDVAMAFPAFDLPLQLNSGTVSFDQQQVNYRDLVATVAGQGQLKINGQTRLTVLPYKTTFAGEFESVSLATWRRLVASLPAELVGDSTGTAKGTFWIDDATRSQIELTAEADVAAGRFSQIEFEQVSATVNLSELVFDERQRFESIAGSVRVDGEFTDQDLGDVFETFEIDSVRRQLSLGGSGQGNLHLELPLETAEQLDSWTLKVTALLPDVVIGGQAAHDTKLTAQLDRGNLVLNPIRGTPQLGPAAEGGEFRGTKVDAEPDAAVLTARLTWPLTETAPNADRGQLVVDTRAVPPAWIAKVIDRLIQNAQQADGQELTELSSLEFPFDGAVDSKTQLLIPTAAPETVDGWEANSTIENSTLDWKGHRLDQIAAQISWKQSQLNISQINAVWLGGAQLQGSGRLNLNQLSDYQIEATSTSTSVEQAIELAQGLAEDEKMVAQLGEDLDLGWIDSVAAHDVKGEAVLNLALRSTAAAAEDAVPQWSIEIHGQSDKLVIDHHQLDDTVVKASVDSNRFEVATFKTTVDRDGIVKGQGGWSFSEQSGQGDLQWRQVPLSWLVEFSGQSAEWVKGGTSQGNLTLITTAPGERDQPFPVNLRGSVEIKGADLEQVQLSDLTFDIRTRNNRIEIDHLRSGGQLQALEAVAWIETQAPYAYQVTGKANGLALSELVQQAGVLASDQQLELTGTVAGQWTFSGDLQPFRWETDGDVTVLNPTINRYSIDDLAATWKHVGDDWKQSQVRIEALSGEIELTELSEHPQRIAVDIKRLDAERLTKALGLPASVAGTLDGDASLNDWSLAETRWADLNLRGSTLQLGRTEFGDFSAGAVFRDHQLSYQLDGSLLAGKLNGKGQVELNPQQAEIKQFPLRLELVNATLAALYGGSNQFRSLRPLEGGLSAVADVKISLDAMPTANGRVQLSDLKWSNALLTRQASMRFGVNADRVLLDDVRADLKRGKISARFNVPLQEGAPRDFQIDVRQLDLQQLTKVFGYEDWEATGLVDTRLGGQLGRSWNGSGFVGVERAALHGVSGQSARIPVQFRFQPQQGSGQLEFRRSKFRFLDGTVAGTAMLEFGRRLNLRTDLQFSNVNSGDLVKSLFDLDDLDQGRLRGRLQLEGHGIRSVRDLNGSFAGTLDKTQVFQLPVLEQVGQFLVTGQIMNRTYDTDEIKLRLNRGRVEVQQLNFYNALARVAVDGFVYLDGRLDLGVVARVEKLNQPTLIDDLLGSPLAKFQGTPAAFFAQAAEFLSNRVVFLKVGGTADRPQIRLDSGQQVKEEAIRYFLRGSGLLPFDPREGGSGT